MTLSSRERVKNLLAGQPVDRVPLRETFWSETLAAWVEQGYPTRLAFKDVGQKHWHRSDGRWVETTQPGEYIEPMPPYQHFSFDMGEMDFLIDFEPLIGYKEIIEETAEWEMYRNGAGGIMKYWKEKSGTPEHVDFRMTTREVWEQDYRPHLLEVDPGRIDSPELAPRLKEIERHQKFSAHMLEDFNNSNLIFDLRGRNIGKAFNIQSSAGVKLNYIRDTKSAHPILSIKD